MLKNLLPITAAAVLALGISAVVPHEADACGGFDGCSGGGSNQWTGYGPVNTPATNAKNAEQARSKAAASRASSRRTGPR